MSRDINHNSDPLFGCLIGASPVMRKVFTQIEKIAQNSLPVFITGETGTGKEKTAEALHKNSLFSQGPFIPFHCAGHNPDMIDSALFGHKKGAFTGALQNRDGAIKQAEGGTLLLGEICDMPRELQLKILRFTQNSLYQPLGSDHFYKANIRLICATRRDPHVYIKDKKFREDLFYRLYVQPVSLPPLKDRNNDIVDLAVFFTRNQNILISPKTIDILKSYSWPGNVRELQNLMNSIILQGVTSTIEPHDLPEHLSHQNKIAPTQASVLSTSIPLRQIEKTAIENTIHYCHGDIVRAAAILEIAPSTIYRKKALWKEWQ